MTRRGKGAAATPKEGIPKEGLATTARCSEPAATEEGGRGAETPEASTGADAVLAQMVGQDEASWSGTTHRPVAEEASTLPLQVYASRQAMMLHLVQSVPKQSPRQIRAQPSTVSDVIRTSHPLPRPKERSFDSP